MNFHADIKSMTIRKEKISHHEIENAKFRLDLPSGWEATNVEKDQTGCYIKLASKEKMYIEGNMDTKIYTKRTRVYFQPDNLFETITTYHPAMFQCRGYNFGDIQVPLTGKGVEVVRSLSGLVCSEGCSYRAQKGRGAPCKTPRCDGILIETISIKSTFKMKDTYTKGFVSGPVEIVASLGSYTKDHQKFTNQMDKEGIWFKAGKRRLPETPALESSGISPVTSLLVFVAFLLTGFVLCRLFRMSKVKPDRRPSYVKLYTSYRADALRRDERLL